MRFLYGLLICVMLALMLGTITYTFSKCGAKAFFLGNGAAYAAFSGLCDK